MMKYGKESHLRLAHFFLLREKEELPQVGFKPTCTRTHVHMHLPVPAANAGGHFSAELVAMEVQGRKGKMEPFTADEHPREATLEKLSQLPPVFKENGCVSAGNASVGREGGREGGRQGGGREAGREAGREGGREEEREGGRKRGREGGRKGRREGGKEGGREGGREEGGMNN